MSSPRGPTRSRRPRRVPEASRCAILSVGTELTEGKIQDTHLRFLGRELASRGAHLERCVHLPDERDAFRAELRRLASDMDLVFVTGGLGPTSDDLTREVVAEAAGVELVYHPQVWADLERRFAGRKLAEANRRQCYAPRGFELLPNRHGTAPGFLGRVDRALVVALPGPPRELEPMFAEVVVPRLGDHLATSSPAEVVGTAHLVGESLLEDAFRACAVAGVRWGTRIADDRIAFYLRGGDDSAREAFYAALVRRVGETHLRRGDRGAAEVLTDALRSARARLAVAESCTGGLLSTWITDLAGSSDVFSGGIVAYSNDLKTALLGVPARTIEAHGAVSEEVALAMAVGALPLGPSDWSIAVSGVAGPGGGSEDKPVGTVWIGVASREGTRRARRFYFPGSREAVRRRSASAACIFAECLITGKVFELFEG